MLTPVKRSRYNTRSSSGAAPSPPPAPKKPRAKRIKIEPVEEDSTTAAAPIVSPPIIEVYDSCSETEDENGSETESETEDEVAIDRLLLPVLRHLRQNLDKIPNREEPHFQRVKSGLRSMLNYFENNSRDAAFRPMRVLQKLFHHISNTPVFFPVLTQDLTKSVLTCICSQLNDVSKIDTAFSVWRKYLQFSNNFLLYTDEDSCPSRPHTIFSFQCIKDVLRQTPVVISGELKRQLAYLAHQILIG